MSCGQFSTVIWNQISGVEIALLEFPEWLMNVLPAWTKQKKRSSPIPENNGSSVFREGARCHLSATPTPRAVNQTNSQWTQIMYSSCDEKRTKQHQKIAKKFSNTNFFHLISRINSRCVKAKIAYFKKLHEMEILFTRSSDAFAKCAHKNRPHWTCKTPNPHTTLTPPVWCNFSTSSRANYFSILFFIRIVQCS